MRAPPCEGVTALEHILTSYSSSNSESLGWENDSSVCLCTESDVGVLCGHNIGPSTEGCLLEFFNKLRGGGWLIAHQGYCGDNISGWTNSQTFNQLCSNY